MKKKESKAKKVVLGLVSFFALIILGWLALFGKAKALDFINPFIGKIPKDQNALTDFTDKVLGEAAETVQGGGFKKTLEKGSDYFESSQYTEPGREIRENVKQKVNEVIQSVKEIPAKEVMIIKEQVCKQWLEEIATQSADQ